MLDPDGVPDLLGTGIPRDDDTASGGCSYAGRCAMHLENFAAEPYLGGRTPKGTARVSICLRQIDRNAPSGRHRNPIGAGAAGR
ncbi:MAG TPA: hypothetical protein VFZ03_09440 [Dongiaceae bacterium]